MLEIETGLKSLASQTLEFEKTVTKFCDSTCIFSEVVMKSLGKTDSYSQEVLKYRQAVNGVTSKGSPHSAISTIKASLADIRAEITKVSMKRIADLKTRIRTIETTRVQIEGMQNEIDFMKTKSTSSYEQKISNMESTVDIKKREYEENRKEVLNELGKFTSM